MLVHAAAQGGSVLIAAGAKNAVDRGTAIKLQVLQDILNGLVMKLIRV